MAETRCEYCFKVGTIYIFWLSKKKYTTNVIALFLLLKANSEMSFEYI
jgi:hypothetical protein